MKCGIRKMSIGSLQKNLGYLLEATQIPSLAKNIRMK